MHSESSPEDLAQARHYPNARARRSDFLVHVVGLTLAITGGAVMLGFAISTGRAGPD